MRLVSDIILYSTVLVVCGLIIFAAGLFIGIDINSFLQPQNSTNIDSVLTTCHTHTL